LKIIFGELGLQKHFLDQKATFDEWILKSADPLLLGVFSNKKIRKRKKRREVLFHLSFERSSNAMLTESDAVSVLLIVINCSKFRVDWLNVSIL
jgi:hypothetical protein